MTTTIQALKVEDGSRRGRGHLQIHHPPQELRFLQHRGAPYQGTQRHPTCELPYSMRHEFRDIWGWAKASMPALDVGTLERQCCGQ